MIEQEDERNNKLHDYHIDEEDNDDANIDFSHIQKHPYINKVFCWIQADQTDQVIRFFETFPHLLDNFTSPNNWNPILYAVRYGNIRLIDYFKEKILTQKQGFKQQEIQKKINPSGILTTVSIVHTAVYSGQPSILEYVVNQFGVPVNPKNCQISPLKSAMKANSPRMVQFLISRGAYYIFGDVYNNLEQKQNIEEQNKYQTLPNKQHESQDISQALVVEQSAVRDCPIKETLRYARVKPIVYLRKCARHLEQKKEQNKEFESLSQILCHEGYFNLMLKVAANKGASIFMKATNADNHQI